MTETAAWDVVVVGGGIIGSTSALALARRGARVLVLERGEPGAEASSAAAGILGAQIEARTAGEETDLFLASRAMYPNFVRALGEASGLDVGYRPSGSMRVARDAEELSRLAAESAWQVDAGLARDVIAADALPTLEPALVAAGAIRFVDDAVVEPALLVRALAIAATDAGVVYRAGAHVQKIQIEGNRAAGVVLRDGGVVLADHVVLAAGSWSALVEGAPLAPDAVRPARGQMMELTLATPLLSHVVFGPGAYLVPRTDGRVVVGSTVELVGFHKDVTARAVRDLLVAATTLCPALEDASLTRTWSGFRPFAPRPLIGPTEIRRLIVATGHHRNGILLAPITGEMVAAAVEGRVLDVKRK